jgi:hypothetical protein
MRWRGAPGDCRQGALPLSVGFGLAGYEVQYDVDWLHEVVLEADRQRMLRPLRTAVPEDRAVSVVRFKGMGIHEEPANIAFLPGGDLDLGDRHSPVSGLFICTWDHDQRQSFLRGCGCHGA